MSVAREVRGTIRLVTANTDMYRGGDPRYLAYLIGTLIGTIGVLFTQERGHGPRSTRLRGIGVQLRNRVRFLVGKVGAHRGVVRADLKLNGRRVRLYSWHALHRRTVGKPAHRLNVRLFARRTRRLNRRGIPWAIGCDGNQDLAVLARRFGGTAHYSRRHDRVVGFIVSDQLEVVEERPDTWGMDRGLTDHPAYLAVITTKETP